LEWLPDQFPFQGIFCPQQVFATQPGIAPSRKLSYQGALGLLPLSALSAIPKYCYLFRLNESHEKMVAKAEIPTEQPF
jgi:hypothetical protein